MSDTCEGGPRIGLVGYNSRSGLGELNRQIDRWLPVSLWLIKPHPAGSDRPSSTASVVCSDGKSMARFLSAVDIVLFAETPYYPHLVAQARSRSKRIVCVPMQEWTPIGREWAEQVDLFVCPTRQCFQEFSGRAPCVCFPWPVDVSRFTFRQRGRVERFLFTEGHGGAAGRKGGRVVREALEIWPEMPLTVFSQCSRSWPDQVEFHGETTSSADLYERGDVLLCPHSADGLGLGPMEAMAGGMPVVTTDGLPWNELPAIGKIDAERSRKKIGRVVDWWTPSPQALVDVCRGLLGTDISGASREARKWAESRSWSSKAEELRRLVVG